VILNHLMC